MNIRSALQANDGKIVTVGCISGREITGRVAEVNIGNDGFVTLTQDTGPPRKVHVMLATVETVTVAG